MNWYLSESSSKTKKDLIVGSISTPEWTDDKYMENFTKTVEGIQIQRNDHAVWIVGDFNLVDLNRDTHTIVPSCFRMKLSQSFLNMVEDQSLSQMVDLVKMKEPQTYFWQQIQH